MRTLIAVMVVCLIGCFDLNGSSWGGQNEPCYKNPPRCESNLVCDDTTSTCGLPKACSRSVDCEATKACQGGVCIDYTQSCIADADCHPDYVCGDGSCTKQLELAAACGRSAQCVSGFCVDAVCCESACAGECQSCLATTNGNADGKCIPFAASTDPNGGCAAGLGCDGAGNCATKNLGAPCNAGMECGSGNCSDGVCCDERCDGACVTCDLSGHCDPLTNIEDPGVCDDAHRSGDCGRSPCACDALGDCKSGGGTPCANTVDCGGTSFCVDGVCCDRACDGVCEACVASKTGGATGTCAPVAVGTDPDSECAASSTCNGSDECFSGQLGVVCNNDYECQSGFCVAATWGCIPGLSGLCLIPDSGAYVMPGVCCESACTDVCHTCDHANTQTLSGSCAPTLYQHDCNGGGWCTNSLECLFQRNHRCEFDTSCFSGTCDMTTHKCD